MLGRIFGAPLRRVSAIQERPAGPTPLIRVPEVGDVVLLYVPTDDKLKTPGPIARPAIVLSTHRHRDGQISMNVCEGVINGKGLGYSSDLNLKDPAALNASGINVATYFNLKNRKTVMWNEQYAAIDKSFPILGQLDAKSFDDMRLAYGAALRTERARVDVQRENAARQATPNKGETAPAASPRAASSGAASPKDANPRRAPSGRELRAMLLER